MTDDETKDVVKKETKPADFATAILERKKAPNRLVVGAFDGRDVASSRRGSDLDAIQRVRAVVLAHGD